jgi:hypothetical protein
MKRGSVMTILDADEGRCWTESARARQTMSGLILARDDATGSATAAMGCAISPRSDRIA